MRGRKQWTMKQLLRKLENPFGNVCFDRLLLTLVIHHVLVCEGNNISGIIDN